MRIVRVEDLWNSFAITLSNELQNEPRWRGWYSASSGREWTDFIVGAVGVRSCFLSRLGEHLEFSIRYEEERIDVSFHDPNSGVRVVSVEHENANHYSNLEGTTEKGWKREFELQCRSTDPIRMLIRYYSEGSRKDSRSIEQQLVGALNDCCPANRRPEMAGKLLHIVGPYSLDRGSDYRGFGFDGEKFFELPLPGGVSKILPSASR